MRASTNGRGDVIHRLPMSKLAVNFLCLGLVSSLGGRGGCEVAEIVTLAGMVNTSDESGSMREHTARRGNFTRRLATSRILRRRRRPKIGDGIV